MDAGVDVLKLVAEAGEDLFHTVSGSKTHIRSCPHFEADTELVPSTPDDVAAMDLCESCEAQLSGRGRREYANLDAAMEAYQVPVANRARVRELVRGYSVEQVWTPYSNSYIGVAGSGHRTIWIGKAHVWLEGERIEFPGYRASRGSGNTSGERQMPACPTCGYTLPATGVCDEC